MQQIAIDTVLSKINDTLDIRTSEVKKFGVRFLTEKNDEIVTREMLFRKRTKGPKQEKRGTNERGKGEYSLKAHGLIAVEDMEDGNPKNITVAMIYQFRDHNTTEWLNVYH